MTETAKLAPAPWSDVMREGTFGRPAISGNTILIGMSDTTIGANEMQGAVYIYALSDSVPQITRTITPPAVTTVPPGGTLGPFTITETNSGNTDVQFYVRWYVTKVNGSTVWSEPHPAALAAGSTVTHEQTFSIPSNSTSGEFVLGISAADVNENELDNDYFPFTVTGAP